MPVSLPMANAFAIVTTQLDLVFHDLVKGAAEGK
jgi:hypothetical protein